jgi:hypothetical protein
MTDYSISPAGEKFVIPEEDKHSAEFERVESLAKAARNEGKEIVVVMGVGFVGCRLCRCRNGGDYCRYRR